MYKKIESKNDPRIESPRTRKTNKSPTNNANSWSPFRLGF